MSWIFYAVTTSNVLTDLGKLSKRPLISGTGSEQEQEVNSMKVWDVKLHQSGLK